MPLIDLVSADLAPTAGNPEPQFDQVAAQADPELLGAGIAAALRATDSNGPAPSIQQLFVHSDALQQADLLNHLLAAAPDAALAADNGALAHLLAPERSSAVSALQGNGLETGASVPDDPLKPQHSGHRLTTLQANAVRPDQVGAIATAVVARAPQVLDDLGRYYARHPTVVKTLGNPALRQVLSEIQHRLQAG